jgi:hypothetical protein
MAALGEFDDPGRGDRHPKLVVFGLGRNSDAHDRSSIAGERTLSQLWRRFDNPARTGTHSAAPE